MKILVICGAGASSTFVAQRLRRAAVGAGVELSASAGTVARPGGQTTVPDLVLYGAHLAAQGSEIADDFAPTPVRMLPDDIGRDLDGTRTLALVLDALGSEQPATAAGADGASSDHTEQIRNEGDTMATATSTVEIASSHGLHARPAKLFAQAAKDSGAKVTIAKGDGKPTNAASILGVISMGAELGDSVTLTVEADDEATANRVLGELTDLLSRDIDAE